MVCGIMLTLLLMGMARLAFNIQQVKAGGTIYIRADGSVDPPTAPIFSIDNITYTFTRDIYETVVVERNNTIIDGNGWTLQGPGSGYNLGFGASHVQNVTIKRTEIRGWYYGFCGPSSINISGNHITSNTYGILLDEYSSNNIILGNNITANIIGIHLQDTSYNVLRNNRIAGNGHNFRVGGSMLSHYINDVDESNTVDGTPIYYWVNRRDMKVPSDAVYVVLVSSVNMTVEGLELRNANHCIMLANTTSSRIANNNIIYDVYGSGIFVGFSSNYNLVYGNNITNGNGIRVDSSSYNSIFGNIINRARVDISTSSDSNFVSGNTINSTEGGVFLRSSSNIVCGNTIANNSYYGVLLYGASYNAICGNTIINSSWEVYRFGGVYVRSSNNKVYHNNFINNTKQADSIGYNNSWHDDYPSGGNYWSDYGGTDLYSGPYQNETGSDEIGDTKYTVSMYANYPHVYDYYPLMNMSGPPRADFLWFPEKPVKNEALSFNALEVMTEVALS